MDAALLQAAHVTYCPQAMKEPVKEITTGMRQHNAHELVAKSAGQARSSP